MGGNSGALLVFRALWCPVWADKSTPSKRKVYILPSGRKEERQRALPAAAASSLPSAQSNCYAQVASLGVTCSAVFHSVAGSRLSSPFHPRLP